jgi:uncharacterized membrane protein required for colicin V production
MNLITLPENITTIINVVFIALLVILALVGYLRGFISQAYDIVVMVLGYGLSLLIASPLAKTVPLLPSSINFDDIPFFGAALVAMIDTVLWTILIVILALIVGLIFKKTLIKKVLHYQKKVIADRIVGAVFSLIPVGLAGFVLALMLSTPLFSNGTAILQSTLLSPLAPMSSGLVQNFITENPTIKLVEKINSGDPLDETDVEVIEETLIDMDFPKNVVDVAIKFVKKEAVTEADVETLKTYAEENQLTEETIVGWVKDLGFTDEQIAELKEMYK